jgi:hypothetical protein
MMPAGRDRPIVGAEETDALGVGAAVSVSPATGAGCVAVGVAGSTMT